VTLLGLKSLIGLSMAAAGAYVCYDPKARKVTVDYISVYVSHAQAQMGKVTSMHASIHPYIHPSIHTYVHTYILNYTLTYLHARTHARIYQRDGVRSGIRNWRSSLNTAYEFQ